MWQSVTVSGAISSAALLIYHISLGFMPPYVWERNYKFFASN